MNTLILIRHGFYDDDSGNLNEYGKEQMENLAPKVQPFINGTVKLLSSIAPRSIQSANIIAKILEIEVQRERILWSDNQHRCNFDKLYEIINSIKEDTVILMTHLEYTEGFPFFFLKKRTGSDHYYSNIDKGEAIVIISPIIDNPCKYISNP